jgi:hypothetical protein
MQSNNKISPHVVVVQPRPAAENVDFCNQFGKNLKVSSCFIMKEFIDCRNESSNVRQTHTITSSYISRTGHRVYSTRDNTECSERDIVDCFCLCGIIPLAVQTAILPITLTWSAADAINKSCKNK